MATTVEQLEARVVALEERVRVLELLAREVAYLQARTPLNFYAQAVGERGRSLSESVRVGGAEAREGGW